MRNLFAVVVVLVAIAPPVQAYTAAEEKFIGAFTDNLAAIALCEFRIGPQFRKNSDTMLRNTEPSFMKRAMETSANRVAGLVNSMGKPAVCASLGIIRNTASK